MIDELIICFLCFMSLFNHVELISFFHFVQNIIKKKRKRRERKSAVHLDELNRRKKKFKIHTYTCLRDITHMKKKELMTSHIYI